MQKGMVKSRNPLRKMSRVKASGSRAREEAALEDNLKKKPSTTTRDLTEHTGTERRQEQASRTQEKLRGRTDNLTNIQVAVFKPKRNHACDIFRTHPSAQSPPTHWKDT